MKTSVLLFADKFSITQNVREHIDAITKIPNYQVYLSDPYSDKWNEDVLKQFDALIIHYSNSLIWNHIWTDKKLEMLHNFPGIKIVFVQDEYRQVNRFQEKCMRIGANFIFSSLQSGQCADQYPDLWKSGVQFRFTLPGYVSNNLQKKIFKQPSKKSPIIRYRSRNVPFYLGKHGQLKEELNQQLVKLKLTSGFEIDSSTDENQRLIGKKWYSFLRDSKISPCVEGGSSTWDFTGMLENKGTQAQAMGKSFSEFSSEFLAQYDGIQTYKTSSPRIFESAALGCVILAVRGNYDGILKDNENCMMINESFSDLEYALEKLMDNSLCDYLASSARKQLIDDDRYSYQILQSQLQEVLENAAFRKPKLHAYNLFSESSFLEKLPWELELSTQSSVNDKNIIEKYVYLRDISRKYLFLRYIRFLLPLKISRHIDYLLNTKLIFFKIYLSKKIKKS